MKHTSKVSTYLRLLRLAKYSPIIALAVALLLEGADIAPAGERIPKGEDPSVL